jgi:ethanolamine ammonia-lyase small subunit
VTARWNAAWSALVETLAGLKVEDLISPMTVRGNDSTLMEILNSQLRHYAVHVGQIVFLAKHFRVRDWDSLSVPKKR